ncbi:MAG: hypothetical protein J5651_05470 [Salinivirgaceae bacterium]|nr:hypothetical protein [Salinivirgaceae bacterium]
MKKRLLAILLVVVSAGAWAQPRWVEGVIPSPKNNTYIYEMASGEANSVNEARTQAIGLVLQRTGLRLGQPVNMAEINRAVQRGENFDVLSATFNIPIREVDYFIERRGGKCIYYTLCQTAVNANVGVQFTTYRGSDNAVAIIKSAFIPGLGQIDKRHYGAGLLTLAGEVALVGAGTLCYLSAQDKLDIMHSDDVSYADFSSARKDYNRLRDASYVIWGAAAGLYVFNLISTGTMGQKKYKGRNKFAFCPTVLPDNERVSPGLAVRVKF